MISVCMASYNGAKYIRQQISSILNQLDNDDELIISDDGSKDDTLSIIESFNDKRIKLYRNKGKHGVNPNFENSLSKAKGDFIFLSDQDDIWLPGKVKRCLAELQNCDCVVHNAIVTDGDLNESGETIFEMVKANGGVIHNFIHNGYLGCAMAFKKNILHDILPIPDNMPLFHDIWIGTIAGIKYKVKFVDFNGILFRRHNSTTSVTAHKRKSFTRIIYNRLSIIYFVGKRILFKI